MRKWFILLALLAGCTTVNRPHGYGTGFDDSDTIYPPACGSTSVHNSAGCANFGTSLYTFLTGEDAGRWAEQGAPFQNWVSTVANANSCLGGTSAGLTMTPTSCVAYNAGWRGADTGSITFANGATTWVAMDENTSGNNANLPNFTRVAGTHYLTDAIDATQPTMAADSQLLMKVVTSGGAITAVTDLRTTTPINPATSVTLAGDATGPSGSNQVTATHLSAPLPAPQGGSGIASPTAHDVMITAGASAFTLLNLDVDTFLQGQGATLDPTAGTFPACANDGVHALVYVSHGLVCETITAAIGVHGQQVFTSNGTFTVPANVYSVRFEAWGPGGGGGGYGAAATNGGNGSASTTVATAGLAGATLTASAGSGGTLAAAGATGTGGLLGIGTNGAINLGGQNGFFGNVQSGASASAGGTGAQAPRGSTGGGTNFGCGGQGGGDGAGTHGAGGGGSGGYAENVVTTTPSSTFAVVVGTLGLAGTGGTANGSNGCNGAVVATW